MRLIAVVGARPNFIKAGPLIPALRADGHEVDLVHTGQHYDAVMSDVFFRDLSIPEPRWYLEVGSGTHAVQTGTAMMRLEELLSEERPDALIVVGDVNSTLAGALAASKLHIPVIHLEAGLRSGDMSMPEEINRLVTDQLSVMHLTPTREADENLLRENVEARRIHFVGNIMAESVLTHAEEARSRTACARFGLEPGGYLLATVHRPENTDHSGHLAAIVAAFFEAPLPVLFPVHPRTRPLLAAHGVGEKTPTVHLVDPVGYLDMLSLQADAAAIVTDSGGVQEESCMLGTPCVTVRRKQRAHHYREGRREPARHSRARRDPRWTRRRADRSARLAAPRALGRAGLRARDRSACQRCRARQRVRGARIAVEEGGARAQEWHVQRRKSNTGETCG